MRLVLAIVFIVVYFAIYCLIRVIDVKFSGVSKGDLEKFIVVLFVRNAQNCVEDVIRSHEKVIGKGVRKIVVDFNSTDETLEILKKMQLDDTFLYIIEDDAKSL